MNFTALSQCPNSLQPNQAMLAIAQKRITLIQMRKVNLKQGSQTQISTRATFWQKWSSRAAWIQKMSLRAAKEGKKCLYITKNCNFNYNMRILMMTRAAQTHQAGNMRPAGRVFETPDLKHDLKYTWTSQHQNINKRIKLCMTSLMDDLKAWWGVFDPWEFVLRLINGSWSGDEHRPSITSTMSLESYENVAQVNFCGPKIFLTKFW